jgi:hypothetical protein
LAGDELNLELVRMDPATLSVRSRTRIPTRGQLAQALNRVVADSDHVYVVGSAIVAVDEHGKLIGRPRLVPGLFTAVIHGTGLVGEGNAKPALLALSADGRIVAKTRLRDGGSPLVVSGRDAWLLGDAGHGNGIVHVRLR